MPSQRKSHSSDSPASDNRNSPTTGTGNSVVPSNESGTAIALTKGTAIRFASGPLMLIGSPMASISGRSPSVITHCTRNRVCQAGERPRRPEKAKISNPTAPKDNQKPGFSEASGSTTSTATIAMISGTQAPRCRKHSRHSRIISTIRQARWTGTSNPARAPYPKAPKAAQPQAAGSQGTAEGHSPHLARPLTTR